MLSNSAPCVSYQEVALSSKSLLSDSWWKGELLLMPASFLMLLACLLIAAKVLGWCAQKIGMPPVLGQLVAGIVIGPSVLGWVHSSPLTDTFANIGVILLMFIAGLETDAQQMRKVGGTAFLSAAM